MKLSFVIPAYNEEKLLPQCLESVLAELGRTPCEAEVVVVNNASTDRTREVALRYGGVRVVDEPKKGLVQARQAGFAATTGELVANIDADTRLPHGWIAVVLGEFARDHKLVALSGPYIYDELPAWQRTMVKAWYAPGWLFDKVVQPLTGRATMLQGGNFVIRRDAWQQAGGFDTSIKFYGEDADVARRIGRQGKVKWTWRLPMYTSPRRLTKEGLIGSALNYGIGLFATHITGKAPNREYTDIRP
jgi:glycosyltransferase involved in cell wall biosynthesis